MAAFCCPNTDAVPVFVLPKPPNPVLLAVVAVVPNSDLLAVLPNRPPPVVPSVGAASEAAAVPNTPVPVLAAGVPKPATATQTSLS